MSIADKLTQIANNVPLVYDAGKASATWKDTFKELLTYKNGQMASLFQGTTFEEFAFKDYNDTEIATNAVNMFTGNKKLKSITPFNTSNVTTMATMFNECPALTEFKGFNTGNCTNFYRTFNACSSLVSVSLDLTSATNLNETFRLCESLENVEIEGLIKASVSFGNSPLNKSSLDNIVEHLGAVTTATITIKDNIDMSDYEDRINAKGWTLVQ